MALLHMFLLLQKYASFYLYTRLGLLKLAWGGAVDYEF